MVVIAEDCEYRCVDLADHVAEVIEVDLTMTNEVATDDDDVGIAGIGDRDGVVLDGHGRDATDVQVRQMRDPDAFEVLEKTLRTRKATDAKPARSVLPRVTLPQKLLSKLSQSFDTRGSSHVQINIIIPLSDRTNLEVSGAFESAATRVRRGPEDGVESSFA
jgi:hypothetical protein